MNRRKWIWWLFYGFGGLIVLFLVIPSLIVIPISFSDSPLLKFPPKGFSWRWYAAFIESSEWTSSLWLSIKVGVGTMIISTVFGVSAALGIVRGNFPGKNLLHAFLLSPMIVPHVITALAMYYFYSSLQMVGSGWALLFSHTCIATPIVIVIVSATLHDFDRSLEQAAQILGADPLQTFRKITFPIIRPGIISGALFSFIISFDEVVIAAFIGGYRSATLPKRMFDNVRDEMDPTVAAISTILILISILLLIVMAFLGKRKTTFNKLKPQERL